MKLEVGEKFLTIKIAGHLPVAAFANKDKKASNQPDYKGDGVAVWINKKKAKLESDVKKPAYIAPEL